MRQFRRELLLIGGALATFGLALIAGQAPAGSYTAQSSRPLEIGQGEPGSALYFPGRVDEAAVYGKALTATQVQTHYRIGSTGH